jgi:hypothetical protein
MGQWTSQDLRVCGECAELFGTVLDGERGVARQQRCCVDNSQAPEPLWPGFDFNRALELCACCAANVVRSGSRWNCFYCAACQLYVDAYNRDGEEWLPVGRHSIMNGVFFDASGKQTEAPAGLRKGINRARHDELFGDIERVFAWRRARVRAVLDPLGAVAAELGTYLGAAASMTSSALVVAELAVHLRRARD